MAPEKIQGELETARSKAIDKVLVIFDREFTREGCKFSPTKDMLRVVVAESAGEGFDAAMDSVNDIILKENEGCI